MAAVYRTNCPHCMTSNVAFAYLREWIVPGENAQRAVFVCGNCSEGIIVSYIPGIGGLSQIRDLESAHVLVIKTWPALMNTDAPADTPERPALYFKQAAESFRNGHFDASGMMFRKCLESSVKAVGTESGRSSLIKRIDALASAGAITSDLREWAHQIRLGGNDAAHEDEPFSKNDAERLAAFCDAFLQYIFTLPALVKKGSALAV